MVYPVDRECRHTLHKSYLVPITDNLVSRENVKTMSGEEPVNDPTPGPHKDAFPLDCPAKSLPDSTLNMPK